MTQKRFSPFLVRCFGKMRSQRTYYRNHTTFEYAHLVDHYAGYKPRQRIDPLMKEEVLEKAIDLSYRNLFHPFLSHNS